MKYFNVSPQAMADALYMPIERMHRLLGLPEFRSIVPRGSFDRRIRINANQAFIVFITGDCVRFGMKSPLAASIALRIAEALAFNADAETVNIEFRRNGASFAFVGNDATDAAGAAGPARWRLSFNIAAYRAAVGDVMAAQHEEVAA